MEDVEKARMSSQSQKDFDTKQISKTPIGIWAEHYESMARKTAIRRLAKYLPLSVEMLRATSLDELSDVGKKVDYSALVEGNEITIDTIAVEDETPKHNEQTGELVSTTEETHDVPSAPMQSS